MTEQQTAPANANLEYSASPDSFSGVWARAFWTNASIFVEPVEDEGVDEAMARMKSMNYEYWVQWRFHWVR